MSETFINVGQLEELDFFIPTTYNDISDLRFKAKDIMGNNLYWVAYKKNKFAKFFFF